MGKIVKIIAAIKIPDLSDEGIANFLSYQPKSDYRLPVKVERLKGSFAIRVTYKESAPTKETKND